MHDSVLSNRLQFNRSPYPVNDDALIGELNVLGVHFVSGGDGRLQPTLAPAILLAGLAMSTDARVQLTLIPLLLVRPDYELEALPAAHQLEGRPHILFCCYYTAAVYLQRQHMATLQSLQLPTDPLPNLFATALKLSPQANCIQALRMLALRQQYLLQDAANWLGAYEHAIQRLLRRRQMEQQWSR